MFMPGLRPDSLGWAVHHECARAVSQRGHSVELLSTADRQPLVRSGLVNGWHHGSPDDAPSGVGGLILLVSRRVGPVLRP